MPDPSAGNAYETNFGRSLATPRGRRLTLPVFFPVFEQRSAFYSSRELIELCGAEAFILNAFFLYRDRELRRRFMKEGLTLQEYLGADVPTMTDSGAFQGFRQRVMIDNKKIVKFQDRIGTDIVSPLDLVTPPGDGREKSKEKAEVTMKRIRAALPLAESSILAGVQQGGRFPELRQWCTEQLLDIGVEYIAVGSLVPFFTQNHDIALACRIVRDTRRTCGPAMPIHVYGSGDPLELPFFLAMGANIFDSSSYAHFAIGGWYMTPFGSVKDTTHIASGEYVCACPACREAQTPEAVFAETRLLVLHNLWTILETIRRLRTALDEGTLGAYLEHTMKTHMAWFPESKLQSSWESVCNAG
ncbi:MAG: 7-cyano-7-deazaguanine tRNA-ribosyltransferase [Candidatus Sumerlaeota bacterium]|nr:7-cyano-7-deazaguanine tRNA-ribosyltransferase [Candidatus Sumerlaeota bacterium]